MTIRAHLEAAQHQLMEAAAQGCLDQERAIFRYSSHGQIRPLLKACTRLGQIQSLINQLNLMLAPEDGPDAG